MWAALDILGFYIVLLGLFVVGWGLFMQGPRAWWDNITSLWQRHPPFEEYGDLSEGR